MASILNDNELKKLLRKVILNESSNRGQIGQSGSHHNGQSGSAIRALIKQKKPLPSDFLKNRFCRRLSNYRCLPIRTCVFII
jgi:hypothetical protein